MLMFRIKMLVKENLMAKTSDIGSCLGLLAGKLLIVGFVIGAFSANAMDHREMKKTRNPNEARGLGNKALRENDELRKEVDQLRAAQTAPGAGSIDIASIKTVLLSRIDEAFEEGRFNSPIKKSNDKRKRIGTPGNSKLRGKINSIAIDIDPNGVDSLTIVEATRSAVIMQCLLIFREYMEQPATDKENLSVVVRSGGSPVRTVAISTESILRTFELTLRGTLDPNLAQLLRDCQLQVALPTVYQPAAPVLDLQKEGERYVKKIMSAIESRESLFNLVQEYRPLDEEAIEMHAMLHLMLGSNISDAASAFKPTQDATTLIEVGDQLRDRFFNTAQLTFIHYMSGQSNKTNVREIIAITNGGRGKAISDSVLFSLNQELEQIFYPRRESGSLTVTTYAFQRPRGSGTSGREPLAIASWTFPLLSATGYLANALFGSCMGPQQHLLTNGDSDGSSSTLKIKDSDEI